MENEKCQLHSLKVGDWLYLEGSEWIIHTIAVTATETDKIVGIVKTDNRCGALPTIRWISTRNAQHGAWAFQYHQKEQS